MTWKSYSLECTTGVAVVFRLLEIMPNLEPA